MKSFFKYLTPALCFLALFPLAACASPQAQNEEERGIGAQTEESASPNASEENTEKDRPEAEPDCPNCPKDKEIMPHKKFRLPEEKPPRRLPLPPRKNRPNI